MSVHQVKKEKKTKDGRSWQYICYYKDPLTKKTKREDSKLFLSKKEAEREEQLFLMQKETLYKNGQQKINFHIVALEYLNKIYKTRKESTGYSYEMDYERHIMPYFKDFDINDISILIVKDWRSKIENKGYSLKYLNGFYNILKGIFDFAIKNYGLESNPIAILGRFERRNDEVVSDNDKLRYITYEQFKIFFSVIDDLMYKTLFVVFYFTGMRKGEIQALNWNDIDFENNVIIVNKTLSIKTKDKAGYKITTTKNYKNRKVDMNRILKEQLLEYKEQVMKFSDFDNKWFVFGNTRFLPQTTIDREKNNYFKLCNLKSAITIHEFRHSHVSLLVNQYIENCMNTKTEIDSAAFLLSVATRIGDTIDTMTRVYMHLFPTIQKPIVNLLDNL